MTKYFSPSEIYALGGELRDIATFVNACSQHPEKCHVMPRRYTHDMNIMFNVVQALRDQLIDLADKTENYDQVELLLSTLGL